MLRSYTVFKKPSNVGVPSADNGMMYSACIFNSTYCSTVLVAVTEQSRHHRHHLWHCLRSADYYGLFHAASRAIRIGDWDPVLCLLQQRSTSSSVALCQSALTVRRSAVLDRTRT